MKHRHVVETLTQTEAAAVFTLADPDGEPLPAPTRTGLQWDGQAWAEIDCDTGAILSRGTVGDELHS